MSSQPSTAEQLQEARLRIAALEHELQLLRASTRSPSPHLQSDHHPSSPRRNQVAAYSDVSRDQSQLSVSCLDLDNRHNHPSPSPSSPVSPLLETKLSSTAPSTNTSPALSDLAALDSKNLNSASNRDSSTNPLYSHLQSNVLAALPHNTNSNGSNNSNNSNNDNTSSFVKQSKVDLATTQQSLSSSPPSLDPTVVPHILDPSPAATTPCSPSRATKTTHLDACNNDNSTVNDKSPSVDGSTTNDAAVNNTTNFHSGATASHAPKRRPPSLSVVKTTTTKKDRSSLVAKCLEPRPGQTRYWTEDEHERFLEAIAEYGEKAYVAISNYVETRTPKQVRTHAQKFQMKMARLARQSLEAGQPIQMPPGMCPVIEVSVGSKSTIVPITPEQTAKICAQSVPGSGLIDPTSIVSDLATSSRQTSKKRGLPSSKQLQAHQQSHQQASKQQLKRLEQSSALREEDQVEDRKQTGCGEGGEGRLVLVGEEQDIRASGKGKGRGKKYQKLARNLNEKRERDLQLEDAGNSSGDGSLEDVETNNFEEEEMEEEEGEDVLMGEDEEVLECTEGSADRCEESCSSLTDACAEFITCGDASVSAKTDMELETNNFVATLNQSLEQDESDDKTTDFLMSEESTNEPANKEVVDDLEDLENLEDGDLPLASFVNATENWLLSEASAVP